ncbi:MAG: acyl-CoA dehydrogenase [Betaproteobacteria bacterium RIFCSPLOWO2_12_FULL_66_14]|nr:MAG: acyl-CoA dehydrogenase [Betaproteobacteria bacterium RIFCSPLOWO2_12_FULL_66_14]
MDHNPLAEAERFAYVDWPFFGEPHARLAREAHRWAAGALGDWTHAADADAVCRRLVREMGAAGWLAYAVPPPGASATGLDLRSICLLRECFAYHVGLADFAFAMQGLGSGAISLAGSEAQKARYLPRVARGEAIAAFALSEPDSGSDVGAIATTARRDADHYALDGTKTWISNGGIADFYVLFARTGEAAGTRGLSAFVVDAGTPGLSADERIEIIAPHPMSTLRLAGCRVPAANLLGAPGEGFKLAMRTLDIFRTSVGAAALGFARRALHEAIGRARERRMFGQVLADFQMTQAKLADMATAIDASALLIYRAAWTRDVAHKPLTRESAMAKMYATEAAQQVIDAAVQLFGGLGVVCGHPVERLYREVRALRIYEGATEVQKIIIARQLLGAAAAAAGEGERQ